MYIEKTLQNELRMLRAGGLFFMTAAGHGRPEHGTPSTDAYSSPNTCKIPEWASYYRNVTAAVLSSILNLEETFQHYFLWYQANDIYLWGIKR